MAVSSRPCDGCGQPVQRTATYSSIPHYCSPECRPRCEIEDCGRAVLARNLCTNHYKLWRKYGDPTKRALIFNDDEARFWSKVGKHADNECWPWLGHVTEQGYGRISIASKTVGAHRYSYELNVGPIPPGLTIDHVVERGCTRRDCVNPAHLEAVTQEENTRRSSAPTAVNARKTHCPDGHELIESNVYVGPTGGRRCRTCRSEQKKRRQPA